MRAVIQGDTSNRLLAALPPEAFALLQPSLQRVAMPVRSVLSRPDEPIVTVHFVETGWVSLLTVLLDGDRAEVGIVGQEGMIGLPLLFGVDRSPQQALVQASGSTICLSAASFDNALDESPPFRRLLLRYAQAQHTQITYTAVCNGRHLIGQRLARWLLISHDRAEGDELPMTHDFLSTMLGVRRAGVSVAAGVLQRAGVIRYEHGRITILDRPRLEAASCECYGAARHEFERLLAPEARD